MPSVCHSSTGEGGFADEPKLSELEAYRFGLRDCHRALDARVGNMAIWEWLFGPTKPSVKDTVSPVHLMAGEDYDFELVGEANYQDALDRVCGGKCEEGHSFEALAQIIFEDGNRYDPNAVAILVEGMLVAYVPRQIAPAFRDAILRVNPMERPVTCSAMIVGGWQRGDGDEGSYGIRLSVSDPVMLSTSS